MCGKPRVFTSVHINHKLNPWLLLKSRVLTFLEKKTLLRVKYCSTGSGRDACARHEARGAVPRLHRAVLFGEIRGPLHKSFAARRKSSGCSGACSATEEGGRKGRVKRQHLHLFLLPNQHPHSNYDKRTLHCSVLFCTIQVRAARDAHSSDTNGVVYWANYALSQFS